MLGHFSELRTNKWRRETRRDIKSTRQDRKVMKGGNSTRKMNGRGKLRHKEKNEENL
jgi:hypothetical protein